MGPEQTLRISCHNDQMTKKSSTKSNTVNVTIRRAPKYAVFMTIGALAGALVGWLIATANEAPEGFTAMQMVGFFVVFAAGAGLALGAIVALVLDAALAKRTSSGTATSAAATDNN